jgi:hypothetical protein
MRAMARLNLTLDEETFQGLQRHASRRSRPAAALARELVQEGIRRREAAERQSALARDYAAGRKGTRALLADLESPQCDLLDDDEA